MHQPPRQDREEGLAADRLRFAKNTPKSCGAPLTLSPNSGAAPQMGTAVGLRRLPHFGRLHFGEWLMQSGREAGDAPAFEEYLNNPRDTAPPELLTDIYLPLR